MKIGALRQARLAASAAGSASACLPPALRARPHTGALNFSLLPHPAAGLAGGPSGGCTAAASSFSIAAGPHGG